MSGCIYPFCFGVIPKNHHQNKWRLITDLSHPPGSSVNDAIPSHPCSLTYVTTDDAILNILQSGRDIMLAKVGIKSAYQCTQQTGTYWE